MEIRNRLMVEEFALVLIEPNFTVVICHLVLYRNSHRSMVDGVSKQWNIFLGATNYQRISLLTQTGPWGSFGECSSECGGGYKMRRRKCDDPEPQNGGLDCSGCQWDYDVCNTHPCSEVKKMGSWTPWMVQLNGSTGDGGQLERRFRFSCKANVPDANSLRVSAKEETRICHTDGSCQRSGDGGDEAGWSDWGSWSQCSVECGGGQQFRTRTCERNNCDGTSKMARACNTHSCKGMNQWSVWLEFGSETKLSSVGVWSCWTDWSPCSVTCGLGKRSRTRDCMTPGKDGCEGLSTEFENCELPLCDCKF